MATTPAWNPRGPQAWPGWEQAEPGQRVEHVRSGRRGTFVRWPTTQGKRSPGYAVIDWDTGSRGRVVAFAFDLKEIV